MLYSVIVLKFKLLSILSFPFPVGAIIVLCLPHLSFAEYSGNQAETIAKYKDN